MAMTVTVIANAVNAKVVAASPSNTFTILATKIGQIETGGKFATGNFKDSYTQIFGENGLDFKPSAAFAFPWSPTWATLEFAFGIHVNEFGNYTHGTRTFLWQNNASSAGYFDSTEGSFSLKVRHSNGPVDLLWMAME